MSGRRRLKRYRGMRDFRKSPEPKGKERSSSGWKKDGNPIFVVQEHRAGSHHFDFRLEIGGVLKSWSVPKGPSTDPSDRRLAVATEDHPLDYAEFEGKIPEGEYGGGTVIVWDAGPYRPLRKKGDGEPDSIERRFREGTIEVWVEGRKIRGGYALVRAAVGGEDSNWLLIKMKDGGADARRKPVRTQTESVLSGRTLDQVADEEE